MGRLQSSTVLVLAGLVLLEIGGDRRGILR